MATYYKYAERQEDAYVDWGTIGKELSDSLLAEKKFREDKKAKIDEDSRQLGIAIDNAPQGQFQDGNKFTLQYASDAQQARLLQDKLLKSGQLSLKDYTVQRQNLNDGTNNLFSISKLYQENYKTRMEGVQSGKLQALNVANLASVEGFADFSKSQAVINAKDGTVNIAGLEIDPATGLKKVNNNIIPVSVLKGKILAEIPTFQVDEAMNKAKAGLGTLVESIYKNATISGAGTITQLTGPNAISRYPQYAAEIKTFNKAIDNQVASWFSNPYNLSSVLTENVGKYHADSFTYDKEVAKSDPSKILLKINPATQLPILDESGANYAAQKKEAEAWVRSSFLSKLDSEVKVTTTAQTQLQERSAANREYGDRKAEEKKDTKLFAEMLSDAVSGNTEQVKAGVQYLQGLGVPIERTKKGFEIFDAKKGTTLEYEFGKKIPDDMVKSLLGAVNIKDYNEDDIVSFASQFNKGRKINLIDTVSGPTKEEKPVEVDIPIEIFTVGGTFGDDKPSIELLQSKLPKGFTVQEGSGVNGVDIIAPNGAKISYDSNVSTEKAKAKQSVIKKWVETNNVSTQGVGGKYN